MRVVIIAIIFLSILSSCSKDDKIVVFKRDEAIRLLSADSNKTWTRTLLKVGGVSEDSNCKLNHLITFYSSTDSLYFEINSDPSICENDSYFLSGYWDVAEDPAIRERINQIMFVIDSDTSFKEIGEITSIFLSTTFTMDNSFIEESYQKRN